MSVAVSKLQVAILARSSVSTGGTSSHELVSQFGLAIFFIRENTL